MTHCPHCDAKDARIELLERELGIRKRDGEIAAIMTRLEMPATYARLLLRLYAANGKPVRCGTLMDVITTDNARCLTTAIYRIRQLVGEGIVEADRTIGYHLTVTGMSLLLGAVQPVEMQPILPRESVGDLV